MPIPDSHHYPSDESDLGKAAATFLLTIARIGRAGQRGPHLFVNREDPANTLVFTHNDERDGHEISRTFIRLERLDAFVAACHEKLRFHREHCNARTQLGITSRLGIRNMSQGLKACGFPDASEEIKSSKTLTSQSFLPGNGGAPGF
jgi:hypothetical protein